MCMASFSGFLHSTHEFLSKASGVFQSDISQIKPLMVLIHLSKIVHSVVRKKLPSHLRYQPTYGDASTGNKEKIVSRSPSLLRFLCCEKETKKKTKGIRYACDLQGHAS